MSNIIKSNNAFPKVLLIGLSLLLFSSVISCDSRAQERQLIIDYIDTMMPVMGAHADWYEDQNILFRTSDPDYSEFMTELRDLLDRIEEIYMDVNTSIPPQTMREFKKSWKRECELCILAVGKLLRALDEENIDLAFEAQELMFEANDVKDEATEKLFDLLIEYNIDINDI